MNFNVRKTANASILDMAGPLKLGESEQQFRDQVQQLLDSGVSHLAINLSGVPEMDSSGIGALVRVFTSIKKTGGKCVIFGATKRVLMILKMVRLDSILEPVEDEATALARM